MTIPPAGRERDETLLLELGDAVRRESEPPPRYSTDDTACNTLVARLGSRGFDLILHAHENPVAAVFYKQFGPQMRATGHDRPDAVSAAALLALRDGR